MGMANMDFVIRECQAVVEGPLAMIRLGTCGAIQPPAHLGNFLVASEGSICVRYVAPTSTLFLFFVAGPNSQGPTDMTLFCYSSQTIGPGNTDGSITMSTILFHILWHSSKFGWNNGRYYGGNIHNIVMLCMMQSHQG